LEEGMDFIWVLNNDTLVEKNCLSLLLRAAEKHPEGCCFSGKIYYDNPPDKLWYAGGYRHWLHLCPKHILGNSLDSDVREDVVEVDFVSGCCMLIPRRILLKYGAFISEYFAYAEDSEWCFRMKNAGKKLFYVPSAVLRHCVSASVRKNKGGQKNNGMTAFAHYLTVRNHLWTSRKHASPFHRKLLAIVIITGLATKNMLILLRYFQWSKIVAIWRGMRHGLNQPLPDNCWHKDFKR
jgi:GT2 family glycosyltransferase